MTLVVLQKYFLKNNYYYQLYYRWSVDFGQNFDKRFHFSESIKSEISKPEKKLKRKDYNLL